MVKSYKIISVLFYNVVILLLFTGEINYTVECFIM